MTSRVLIKIQESSIERLNFVTKSILLIQIIVLFTYDLTGYYNNIWETFPSQYYKFIIRLGSMPFIVILIYLNEYYLKKVENIKASFYYFLLIINFFTFLPFLLTYYYWDLLNNNSGGFFIIYIFLTEIVLRLFAKRLIIFTLLYYCLYFGMLLYLGIYYEDNSLIYLQGIVSMIVFFIISKGKAKLTTQRIAKDIMSCEENDLQELSSELELIANSVPIGICKVDKDLNFLWTNDKIQKMYNVAFNAKGYNYENILDPTIYAIIQERLKEANKDEIIEIEGAMTPDFKAVEDFEEGLFWIKVTYVPMKDKNGQFDGYVILNEDRTKEFSDNLRLTEQKEKIKLNLKNKLVLLANSLKTLSEAIQVIKKEESIAPLVKRKLLKILTSTSNKQIIKEIDFEFIMTEEIFYRELTSDYPNLTPKNLQLCSYLRMNLSSKEIAALTFTTKESVKVARSRLRKKLGILSKDASLSGFLNSIQQRKSTTK